MAQIELSARIMMHKRRGRPRKPREMYLAVAKFGVEHPDATAVEAVAMLDNEFPEEPRVSPRWASRELKKARELAASAAWSLADADAADAALVLPVFRVIVDRTEGRISALTKKQAEWVLKVRKAADDLSLRRVWNTAIYYLLATERNDESEIESLNAFIERAPWRSLHATQAFLKWVVDNRPAWVLERRTIGETEVPKGHPIGVMLRPVRRGQAVPADPVGVTAGVALALETKTDLEQEAHNEPASQR